MGEDYYLSIYGQKGERVMALKFNTANISQSHNLRSLYADYATEMQRKNMRVRVGVLPGEEQVSDLILKSSISLQEFLDSFGVKPAVPRPLTVWYKDGEASKIDLSPEILIEELRVQISDIRGKLSDIGSVHPLWKDRLTPVQGALTCMVATLHDTMKEMQAFYHKHPFHPPWRPKREDSE